MSDPPWLHPKIPKAAAEELLLSTDEPRKGRYLVRRHKDPTKFVLSIMFKGKPTHHMCTKGDDGVYTVNGKTYGANARTIVEMIDHLRTKPEGWPVRMTNYVGLKPAAEPSSSELADSSQPWLYGPEVNKAKAEQMLAELGNQDGQFLVRGHRDHSKRVLSVVYKGKPTHHLCVIDKDRVLINDKQFGDARTIAELVDVLRKSGTRGWPVPLTDFPSRNDQGGFTQPSEQANKPPERTTAEDATAASSINKRTEHPWFHTGINKEGAETLLESFGLEDGTFLVREHKNPDKAVLSVVYRSRPTHHMISLTDKPLTVNGKVYVDASTLNELISLLSDQPVKGWPVLLGRYPSNGLAVEESAASEDHSDPNGLANTNDQEVNIASLSDGEVANGSAGGFVTVAGGYTEPAPADEHDSTNVGYIDIQASEDAADENVDVAIAANDVQNAISSEDNTLSVESGAVYGDDAADEDTRPAVPTQYTIRLNKPSDGGYGWFLANHGHGNFVYEARDQSVGQLAILKSKLSFDSGLRVKEINGVDVMNESKAEVIALMKGAPVVDVEIMLDPEGYAMTMKERSNVDEQTIGATDSIPIEHQLFWRNNPAFEVPSELSILSVPPELEDAANGAYDWHADTIFSAAQVDVPTIDTAVLQDENTPGYVGSMELMECNALLRSTLAGSYVIRRLQRGNWEVVVKHVADDALRIPIVERPDGRFEYMQRLYYRLRDVMKEIARRPIKINDRRGQAEMSLGNPVGVKGQGEHVQSHQSTVAMASSPGLLQQDEADLMAQMTVNPAILSLGR